MGKYTHQQLKHKTLEELQKLYQKEHKWINDFKPIDSEEDGSNTKKAGKRIKRIADSTSKQKSPKKSKVIKEQESAKSNEEAAVYYEQEKEELRMWLAVVLDEDETVDPKILSVKYPIVDWESQNLGSVDMEDIHVYKIIRADGNTSYHKTFSSMLRKFDRQDLMDLHRLVMKRFEDNTPEGYNLLLWGDLKVMFEPNAEDEIWSNQQDWTLISWKLYENYGVHSLLMDGTLTCFNMLVEKRYPLIKEMLKKMLNWKLEAEAESTMAFELLKFIKSQFKGGLLGIMDFYNLVLLIQLDTAGDENIDQFLNGFTQQPNEIDEDNLEPDDESVDTPLVSPFLDSDDDSDDDEVLNELEEYGNAGQLCRQSVNNSFDGDDLAFQCMIGFRNFVAYFDPFLPMNIITHKAYNTIMVEGLESTGKNLVAIVRDVYVVVGSFTYITDFVVLKYIGEFMLGDIAPLEGSLS
ncbi:hypothetical protein Tco_0211085 [Tanacetum coccineum]